MASTTTVKCKNCHAVFTARVADRKRGWARFCSKSCKARRQEALTHQYSRHLEREMFRDERDEEDILNGIESGWDGHKIWLGK